MGNALIDILRKSKAANQLRELAQSASNAVAGNVAGPVDLINMGLGYAGLPVSNAPVGGTEWMKQRGLMTDVPQGSARVLGETAGMIGPTLATQFAPQIARGLLQAGNNLAAPRTLNPQTGAIVWHGSPHKFDKFDSSKIGTGEGAQAYGHGLYLAESPGVAESYRSGLSKGGDALRIDGAPASFDMSGPGGVPGSRLGSIGNRALMLLQKAKSADNLESTAIATGAADDVLEYAKQMLPRVSWEKSGGLYKVDLPDEHIAKMLDWDKPLSQQAPEVQKALRNVDSATLKEMFQPFEVGSTPGSSAYNALMRERATQSAASDVLRQQGIPGIRYLDGGSRGAGSGTSNYVVFPGNENMLQILERNGTRLAK